MAKNFDTTSGPNTGKRIWKTPVPTRSGVQPDDDKLNFTIKTEMVRDYFQKKVNFIINRLRDEGKFTGEDVIVNIITVNLGSSGAGYTPMIMRLSDNAAINMRRSNDNEELSVFHPNEHDRFVRMIPEIARMVSLYAYDRNDAHMLNSPGANSMFGGISHDTRRLLVENIKPRRINIKSYGGDAITFVIDPIRVFFDMVYMEGFSNTDPINNYTIKIPEVRKTNTGTHVYKVERITNRKNKGRGNSNERDLMNALRSKR